jgi:uncharacterized protein (DUF1697 family)
MTAILPAKFCIGTGCQVGRAGNGTERAPHRGRRDPGHFAKMHPVARFVALLGGINVGGHRVSMERLRAELTALGYTDVGTFIASGNLMFTAPARGDHEARIEQHLVAQLGWPVPTFVRSAAQLIAASDLRPFGPTPAGSTHMVAFCRSEPGPDLAEQPSPIDRFHVDGRELHWLIRGRLTESKITLPRLAKLIGPNTTRNITSLERLADLVR